MIILYSTHCPKCNILEKKLKEKNMEYQEINDIDLMINKGISSAPWLEINGEMMDFNQAIKWVNEQ